MMRFVALGALMLIPGLSAVGQELPTPTPSGTFYIGTYAKKIMVMDEALRAQITSATDGSRLRELAIKLGMRPLRISGADKVSKGLTTVGEVFGVVPSIEHA